MNELQQHDIFLSYSRSNDKKALDVFESLGAQGWTVFMDKDIPNAALWDKYLKNQLNTVKCILVLWSKEAVESKWVRKEASIGKERRNLVHANLDGCDIPSEFSDMHYNDLSKWNYFNVHYPQYLKVLEY
ncbi:MAG: toll/interleukin-1 receptor domain-containing protein, partial [Flavobacteriaceae bacterium]|nr:toll/interleukin-1 receptor domain-containing protein [Flavobacteriaceae bacterium]